MAEQHYTRIVIQTNQETLYYTEQETADYTQMEVQLIRRLQTEGLVEGVAIHDIHGEERRYREEDIAQLRRIRRLHRDLGVNLAGIEIILRLSARLEALQRELEH